MARKRIPRIIEFKVPYAEGDDLNVKAKVISFGEVRKVLRELDNDNEVDMMDFVGRKLAENIVWWDYEEEDGSPIPVNQETIDGLEFTETIAIVNAWLSEMTGPNEELGKDSSSGVPSPELNLTAEAL